MNDYQQYLKTPEWTFRADAAKFRAGYRCQVCNKSGLLDAHHRIYDRVGHELLDDLAVLCRDCHSLYEQARKLRSSLDGDVLTSKFLRALKTLRPFLYALCIAQARRILVSGDSIEIMWDTERNGWEHLKAQVDKEMPILLAVAVGVRIGDTPLGA